MCKELQSQPRLKRCPILLAVSCKRVNSEAVCWQPGNLTWNTDHGTPVAELDFYYAVGLGIMNVSRALSGVI